MEVFRSRLHKRCGRKNRQAEGACDEEEEQDFRHEMNSLRLKPLHATRLASLRATAIGREDDLPKFTTTTAITKTQYGANPTRNLLFSLILRRRIRWGLGQSTVCHSRADNNRPRKKRRKRIICPQP